MPAPALERIPGALAALAAATAVRRRVGLEWRASRPHHWLISWPAPEGLAVRPRDLRPADPEGGRRILAGGFLLGGESLASGARGDPWDRAAPSRRFAEALHGFSWMGDLCAVGEAGAWEGLRLTLGWRRLFGRWNRFAWDAQVLERRVFNLACAIGPLSQPASDAEAAEIAADLARQARYLLGLGEGPARAAERSVAAAVAGAALAGEAGEQILARALGQLIHRLPQAIGEAGGHASRSPQAALELYFDLCTLDDALAQLGQAPPEELSRGLDRLAAAVRFLTLADGRLAAFQGGEALPAAYVAAARAQDEAEASAAPASLGGYHKLHSRALQVVVDGEAPARGAWSVAACAQPLALELLAGGRRLITGAGWSPPSHAPQALRLVDAASSLSVGEAACGAPLAGFSALQLGARLIGAGEAREVLRHEAPGAVWIELEHDGWLPRFGFRHERRLYLDRETDELRGEDRLVPAARRRGADGRRFVPFMIRFHLAPQVSALIARDRKSVLIKAEGAEAGWWLRHDAADTALEPAVQLQGGQVRHGEQIVLRGQSRLDGGARVRWKLSAAHSLSEAVRVDAAEVPA